jgi:hypothetical protein
VVAPVTAPQALTAAAAAGVDLPGIDATLAEVAAGRPHADLARVVRHYLACLDPDGPEPDPTQGRALTLIRHADGRLGLRGELDPVGGEKLSAALESLVQAHRPAGDPRTRAQRLGDALVQLADLHLGCATLPLLRGARPQVGLLIDAEDLLSPATGPGAARAGFGAIVSAARARWMACDADLTRIVLGADGVPLDVGRTYRLVTPGIRRAVEVRDQHCVFAGCDAPVHWCEVHHLVPWWLGGETSLGNSGLLCERHHTQVHHGFRIHRDDDGVWHTYRPDGSEILVGPHLWLDPGGGRDGPADAGAGTEPDGDDAEQPTAADLATAAR